jgi:xanthine/CO dehydrogenase XdhC/CoxF family maturation factor
MARLIGWSTTVVDGRPTHANALRFSQANKIIVGKPETVLDQLSFDHRTAIVLMTHNYNYDLAMLASLQNIGVPYIGLLGPAAKRDRLLNDLAEKGIHIDGSTPLIPRPEDVALPAPVEVLRRLSLGKFP